MRTTLGNFYIDIPVKTDYSDSWR